MYAAQPATCGLRGAVAQGRLRRPGPHRPRVYKSGSDQCWDWECPCGASGRIALTQNQHAATIAALVHVNSQPASR
jgi:hypothetical protein